ncbi:hypothetical protein AB4097_10015 [Microvirga sp. 2MCAF35]|uniref:hypothetical protein n=1 Tax=Microvirga sp. 2MCAF35 TaxID=3232987 RepID=UPI003F990064
MRIAGFLAVAGLGLIWAASDTIAQGGSSGLQGTWLSGSEDCAEVFSNSGKGTSFKKPVDIFAPAFIVSGKRLRTPQASCSIKSIRPAGDRQLLVLGCANAVAGNEVRVLMASQPDGTLKRYLNERDTGGTAYRQCSR